MILMLYLVLFIALAYTIFSIQKRLIYRKAIKNISGKRIKNTKFKFINYEQTKEYLKIRGNPFKLNVEKYYIYKVLGALVSFRIVQIYLGYGFALIGLIPGFFIIDLLIKKEVEKETNDIRLELAKIEKLIVTQVSAGSPIENALTEIHTEVENKRFMKDLKIACEKINLDQNVEAAMDDLSKKYIIPDVKIFCETIKQSTKSGMIEKMLNGQIDILNQKNIVVIKKKNKSIETEFLVITGLYFLGFIMLIIIGVWLPVVDGLNGIMSN